MITGYDHLVLIVALFPKSFTHFEGGGGGGGGGGYLLNTPLELFGSIKKRNFKGCFTSK